MNITPTPEVVTELAARCIYLLSNLRSWQREYDERRTNDKEADVLKWETRTDEFLKDIGATDFESLSSLITQLTIKTDK